MSPLRYKAFYCITFMCFIQKAVSINPEIDNEGVRSKISDIVGSQQLALRSFLNQVKLDRQTFDHDIQATIEKTKNTLTEQVQNIIETLDAGLKTGEQQNQSVCAEPLASKIKELSNEADLARTNCIAEGKPSNFLIEKDTTRHADFQTKISKVPQGCVTTNDDSSTVIKCVEKAMDHLIKEIKDSENEINNKLADIKLTVKNMETFINDCQQKTINDIQDKSNSIQEEFNKCITTKTEE